MTTEQAWKRLSEVEHMVAARVLLDDQIARDQAVISKEIEAWQYMSITVSLACLFAGFLSGFIVAWSILQ